MHGLIFVLTGLLGAPVSPLVPVNVLWSEFKVNKRFLFNVCLAALWKMLYKNIRALTRHGAYLWFPAKHDIKTHLEEQKKKKSWFKKKINSCLPLNDAALIMQRHNILKLLRNWILEPAELQILMRRLMGKAGLHWAPSLLLSCWFFFLFQCDKWDLNNCCVNLDQLLILRGLRKYALFGVGSRWSWLES